MILGIESRASSMLGKLYRWVTVSAVFHIQMLWHLRKTSDQVWLAPSTGQLPATVNGEENLGWGAFHVQMSPTTISPEFSPSAQLRRTPKSARHQTKRGHPCAPEVAYHPDKAIPNLPTQPCLFVPIETAIRSLGDACLSFDKPNQNETKKLKLSDGASLWPIRSREVPVLSTPVLSPVLGLQTCGSVPPP